jgi:glutaredoxin
MEATPDQKILVYGALWCSDCRRSKKFLTGQQVNFDWIDVENDPVAAETMQKINGGVQSIPTIVLPDGQILIEPTNQALAEALSLNPVR